MYIFENRITLEDRALLEEYLNGFDYKASGLCYTSLFMWRNISEYSWDIIGDYLCISGVDNIDPNNKIHFFYPPLTKTGNYDPESLRRTILAAKEAFEKNGAEFLIMLVPFHMNEILEAAMPGEFLFEADRTNFDYIYDTKDLIELKGRELHSKKNHLNYFHNNYSFEYKALTEDMADEAMRFIDAFNKRKNLTDPVELMLLEMEADALRDVFLNLNAVGYLTGAIIIDGKIEALSIGGKIGRKTVVVHVEKANIEYRGLYQAINNEFCKHMAGNVKRINREEDMGLPGLRKAKLSYKPTKFVEKYTLKLKSNDSDNTL
jgi:hypothetical protein